MPTSHEEFVHEVQRRLRMAGYDLVGETDTETPGVRVSRTPAGALVSWTPLSGPSPRTSPAQGLGEATESAVRAAVETVLLQHGYTIWTERAGNGITVLLPHLAPPLPAHRETPDD
ncbi:hypothetical protein [Streptomyces glaucescens]|uniref:Uncharacterized protein n=1 Tax=Streptomyces glaucescens TaxID=1907 RepID=A0A089Z8U9_STRGA|nr:hypothetical protein [Streptomyces glaucescens]AIS02211.1 hypothetical protein SGLAU_31385 [Streptomyces glaucescens]